MADRSFDEALAQKILRVGLVTEAQVESALQAQAERGLEGQTSLLGEILVQHGQLTDAQRDDIEKKLDPQRAEARSLGPYQILKKVGEGVMGVVYLAKDPIFGNNIAIKVLTRVVLESQGTIQRFLRQVEYARKLDHPNIVKVDGSGEDKGFHYYAMEYVEGETLGARLKREKFLPPDEATEKVLQVARGLKYAHDLGYIHRDIKPDNVIVSHEGVAKILDMGLSKNFDDDRSFRTVTEVALGTPHYIAPEQVRGDSGIDGRADIYSLGATYYHLVTGETPFQGTRAPEIIAQRFRKQIPDPRSVREGIPDSMVQIIRRMMAKKPQDRYGDCGGLIAELELALGGGNPSVQVLEVPLDYRVAESDRAERLKRPSPSRFTGRVVAAALVIVLAAIGLTVATSASPPPVVKQSPVLQRPTPPEAEPLEWAVQEMTEKTLDLATGGKELLTLDLGEGARMELVYVKPAIFTMGGTQAPQHNGQEDERPEHRVMISKGYFLGKYEVTKGQFSAFVKATGYETDAERAGRAWGRPGAGGWAEIQGMNWRNLNFTQTDDHPVVCVSWNDAQAFCKWGAGKTGRGMRLPTEAEWEYACRAGMKRWSFGEGESVRGDQGWIDRNSGAQTHGVGQREPNEWALYDMHGNVWEWCQDWLGPYAGDGVDPMGPASGARRCLRGGSWNDSVIECRSTFRGGGDPAYCDGVNGFRVASF